MSALRLARGFTHRDRVITFAGCYHGHADPFLARAGSGLATLGIASSPGVPSGVVADTIVCEYNDVDGVASAVERYGEGLAAIFVEPVAGNMGCVPPEPGFLEALRLLCDASGALLVFDEVITGFRVARGGAQARFGVTPDLTVLGKIVGGGLPLAAFGGRADVMEHLAPSGAVYQAGTLSGNPLATAAGVSVLRRLRDPGVYDELERAPARLADGLAPFGRVQRVGAMLTLFAGRDEPVERFTELDTDGYAELFRGLYERGVYVAPSQYECLFPSLAHTDEVIDQTIDAFRPSTKAEIASGPLGAHRGRRGPESPVWAAALRQRRARARCDLVAPRAGRLRARARDGLRGVPRALRPAAALRPARRGRGVLLGDYLYAHGLVRIAEAGGVPAVAALAELIARCAAERADGRPDDGAAWVDAARALGGSPERGRGRARSGAALR